MNDKDEQQLIEEDAAWDALFERSPQVLNRIFERGEQAIAAGNTIKLNDLFINSYCLDEHNKLNNDNK